MGSLLGPHSSTASLAVGEVAPSGLRAWRETMRSLAVAFPFIGDALRLCACDGRGVRVLERPEARTSTRSIARISLSPRTYASVSMTSRSLLSRFSWFFFSLTKCVRAEWGVCIVSATPVSHCWVLCCFFLFCCVLVLSLSCVFDSDLSALASASAVRLRAMFTRVAPCWLALVSSPVCVPLR